MSGLEWNTTVLEDQPKQSSTVGEEGIYTIADIQRDKVRRDKEKRNLQFKPPAPSRLANDMSGAIVPVQEYTVEEPDSDEIASAIVPVTQREQRLERAQPTPQTPAWYTWLSSIKYLAAAGSFWAANTYFKVTGQRLGPKMAKHAAKTVAKLRKNKKTASPRKQTRSKTVNRGGPSAMTRVGQNASQLSVAPVAIGNTVTGKVTSVKKSRAMGEDTEIVIGREFCFPARATAASVLDWALVGGAPLSPAAFVDSRIRLYNSMYSFYRVNKVALHYVTSSSTSSTGDIMFYYNKDRGSVFVNPASPNFLPFVLSDPHTLIGPQWQNNTVFIETDKEWKRTDYGMTPDIAHYASGDVFFFSKTATADSPGYLLMDYEIEFRGKTLTPRALLFPLPKILWTNVVLSTNTKSVAADAVMSFAINAGNLVDGTTTSTLPTGSAVFDIFKVILDMTHSTSGGVSGVTWGDITYANPLSTFSQSIAGNRTTIPFADGTTLYAVLINSTTVELYPSYSAAAALSGAIEAGTGLSTATMAIEAWFSYAGSFAGANIQPNM